jgi:lipocalin
LPWLVRTSRRTVDRFTHRASGPAWWLTLVALAGCAHVPVRATTAPTEWPLTNLLGRWQVVATTFPMWEKRCDVTFTYGADSPTTLTDRVGYTEGTTAEVILGVDTQHAEVPTHFTWQGLGLLSLFHSEWDVVAVAPDASWVVLTFGATLATPAGADVISRTPTLDDETLAGAVSVAAADDRTAAKLRGLFRVRACGAAGAPAQAR